jgi:selenocysteine lyase/cysteine desulfurase
VNVEKWRSEFSILARKNYLNSCSLGALSHRATTRIAQFHAEWDEWGASAWYDQWTARLFELRDAVGRLLNAERDEIALTASVSAALSTVASAVDYRARPQIVVSELDFPTLAYQWMVRPEVEVVRVRSDDGATIDPARFEEAVTERTAVLATSHVFFTTGAIQDLRRLARIAHDRGALFLVDAYQSGGQVPIDVREADADVLVTGPLKWLLGGPGLAYLYVRQSLIERLVPRIAGWFGAESQFGFDITEFEFKHDARRFELGTPSLPTVHAALGGQSIIDEVGMPAIRDRNRSLTERLIAAVRANGFNVRCAAQPNARSAIVMVAHDDPGAAVAALSARNIIVDWRPGYVRVSPHFYNTEAEIDAVAAALAESSQP